MEAEARGGPVLGADYWRIGVLLGPLGTANRHALKYLVLNLNRLQGVFEFEIHSADPSDELMKQLAQPVCERLAVRNDLPAFRTRAEAHIQRLVDEYRCADAPPDGLVVLSTARFSDTYYTTRRNGCAVLALGNWDREMAPPSFLEFVLVFLMREAIAIAVRSLARSVHLGTKGCLLDFTMELDEARYKVLHGHICRSCADSISAVLGPARTEEIRKALSNDWLGSPDDPRSPASISAKLGHDLFITRGISTSLGDRVRARLEQEGIKQALTLIGVVLAAIVSLRLGLNQPAVVQCAAHPATTVEAGVSQKSGAAKPLSGGP